MKYKNESIKEFKSELISEFSNVDSNSKQIENLTKRVNYMLNTLEIDKTISNENYEKYIDVDVEFDYKELYLKISDEVLNSNKSLPELNDIDKSVAMLAGVVASIVDIFLVSIPKESEITNLFRQIGVDNKGKLHPVLKKLEKLCSVPYDKPITESVSGFYPKNHRLKSFAHDPLIGLIFAIFDIINGSLTFIDKGVIRIVKTNETNLIEKIFSVFIWIGHIISDVCTKQGIPVPGWVLTQMLQFGEIGDKNKTFADIANKMYEEGYDLRHCVTMASSSAILELIVRVYFHMSNKEKNNFEDKIKETIASREIKNNKRQMKLHKMLFISHSIATTGNGIKIFLRVGNPLALNIVEVTLFLKESATMYNMVTRDKTVERIVDNRELINQNFERLLKDYSILEESVL